MNDVIVRGGRLAALAGAVALADAGLTATSYAVSYTHLRPPETSLHL